MSFPRYPTYKPSGVEWLGEVPSEWKVKPLKSIARVINGFPFDSKLFDPNEGFPLVRIRDLNGSSPDARYKGEFIDSAAISNDDVLIGMDGDFNVGRWLGEIPALLNQRMCCVRADTPMITRYLQYVLPAPLDAINKLTYATTVKHLSSFDVMKIRVAMPPDESCIAEVVSFLDHETAKIDALIAEQQRLIELLQEKRQAVISHAVTKGLNPAAPMKDSGVEWLGEVPAHWVLGKLSYYAVVSTGATPDRQRPDFWGGDIPWIKTGEVRYEDIQQAEECITELALKETSCDLLQPGTLLMALYGQGVTRGRVGLLAIPAACNQACAAIKPFPVLIARFLELYFVNAYTHIRSLGNETTQQNLNLDYVRGLEVLLPPQEEQDLIWRFCGERIKGIVSLLGCSFDAIALLQERRSALISAAVTGQIDVRGLVPEAEAA